MKKLFIATAAFMLSASVQAQQKLSIDELVNILIENNYSIKIADQQNNQAQNNFNISPMLPTLSATARQSQSTVGTTTNTLGVGANLNWQLFDGLAMFSEYNKNKTLLEVSQLNKLATLEDLVRQVVNHYYLIVSLDSRAKVARELIKVSQRRYADAELRYKLKSYSRLEMTLAKSDLNTDSTYLIRQLESLDLAYITLNNILNLESDRRDYINDTIIMAEQLDKSTMSNLVKERNTEILLADKGVEISDLNLRLAKAAAYPTIDFSAGYNYNAVNERPAESFKSSNGINWGFTIGVKIFDAMRVQRTINNSRIDQNISSISQESVVTSVISSFNSQYVNYINNLQLIDFEAENSEAMRFNLDIAYDRYQLGDLSGIDFRNIQQQYLSAEDRKINALYLAKSSEISLKALAGIIIERK